MRKTFVRLGNGMIINTDHVVRVIPMGQHGVPRLHTIDAPGGFKITRGDYEFFRAASKPVSDEEPETEK